MPESTRRRRLRRGACGAAGQHGDRTTCPYCGVGCRLVAAADGALSADPDHPANKGRLCSKGAALGDTLATDGRLLHPQIGGRNASWDEALDRIAAAMTRAMADHGPDSVALYVSGQFLTEDYYVANKLMKEFVGSANIDTNSRLCMASSVAGQSAPSAKTSCPAAMRTSSLPIWSCWSAERGVVPSGAVSASCRGARKARHQGRRDRSAPHGDWRYCRHSSRAAAWNGCRGVRRPAVASCVERRLQ